MRHAPATLTKNTNIIEFAPLTKLEDIIRYGDKVRITHHRKLENGGQCVLKTRLSTYVGARNYYRACKADGYTA